MAYPPERRRLAPVPPVVSGVMIFEFFVALDCDLAHSAITFRVEGLREIAMDSSKQRDRYSLLQTCTALRTRPAFPNTRR